MLVDGVSNDGLQYRCVVSVDGVSNDGLQYRCVVSVDDVFQVMDCSIIMLCWLMMCFK